MFRRAYRRLRDRYHDLSGCVRSIPVAWQGLISLGLCCVLCHSSLAGVALGVEPTAEQAAASVHEPADHAGHGTAAGHAEHAAGPKLGTLLRVWSMLPFALLLTSIAVFPLANPHWWEHNRNKAIIAALFGIPVAAYLWQFGAVGQHALQHVGQEYVSFLLLLGSLFVISGGVYVRGTFSGTPLVNTACLCLGGVLASVVGTTGASMLLIRPLLRANAHRARVTHTVIFFIFIVSNCGGLLTPLGDPPLFLGFLKGVPFTWTLRLYPVWLVVNILLLVIYFVWDSWAAWGDRGATDPTAQEQPVAPGTALQPEPFGLEGIHNLLLLVGVIAVIYCSGQNIGGFGAPGEPWPWGLQEVLMFLLAVVAYCLTSRRIREKNRFGFGPIIEVAVLFAGIFVTMIPALAILNVEGKTLGLTEPWQLFWVSGLLSSVLDNAPTYLTFAVTAAGMAGIEDQGRYLAEYLAHGGPEAAATLAAISCGAVLMGANTYIGNGPNFMVKAIAEENQVRMPGFFGYIVYSAMILLPVFVLVTYLFFL